MKFEEILEINKNLIKVKETNKKFNFELAKKIADNLKITNKIVDEQNKKLQKLVIDFGELDGYDYVIPENEDFKIKYEALYNDDIECEQLLTIDLFDVTKCEFDIETIELLIPILNIVNGKTTILL